MILSILVVDDEPRTREMLRLLLELKGFKVSDSSDDMMCVHK